ncbi:MAG: nucleotide exchange factor GrpE [Cyanothece sp. SIO1E1]|nr:nucleotide exchange factor GrpE [Cyanothece sp. SIO1E1]
MIDEVNQVDNTQESTLDASENSAEVVSEIPASTVEPEANTEVDPQIETVPVEAAPDLEFESVATDATSPAAMNGGKVEELLSQIETLQAQLEDRTSQYVRIAADFDNFRKRNQKEKEDLELTIKCSTISELLPVVDNFERARSQIKPQNEQEMTIHKSYQSLYKQLVECLKRIGVAPMRAEGQEFDPNLHEAVMRQPTEEYPEGIVMEELMRGYLLGERVLRHAMVKVAAPPEPMVTSEEGDQGEAENL